MENSELDTAIYRHLRTFWITLLILYSGECSNWYRFKFPGLLFWPPQVELEISGLNLICWEGIGEISCLSTSVILALHPCTHLMTFSFLFLLPGKKVIAYLLPIMWAPSVRSLSMMWSPYMLTLTWAVIRSLEVSKVHRVHDKRLHDSLHWDQWDRMPI